MLNKLLTCLEDSNEIHASLMEIAIALASRGVHAVQYGIFGEALLLTLHDCLKDEFTPYMKSCWVKVRTYYVVSGVLI